VREILTRKIGEGVTHLPHACYTNLVRQERPGLGALAVEAVVLGLLHPRPGSSLSLVAEVVEPGPHHLTEDLHVISKAAVEGPEHLRLRSSSSTTNSSLEVEEELGLLHPQREHWVNQLRVCAGFCVVSSRVRTTEPTTRPMRLLRETCC